MKYVILALSAMVLIVFSIHYPLATTWPIGGDAAVTIRDAKNISGQSLLRARYPLFPVLFNLTRLLPTDWPGRYTWMMAAGHVATGLALAAWMYRVSGWRAAAAGMAFWALTTTTINNHFEDGTIAQLWSLPWLLLFFERLTTGSLLGSLIMLGLAFLTHPLSGLLLLASLLLALPILITQRQWLLLGTSGVLVCIIGLATWWRPVLFRPLLFDTRSVSVIELIRSFFGPFVMLAPVGCLILVKQLATQPVVRWLILSWLVVILLLVGSDRWQLPLAPARWQTYLILAICAGAALAWPRLVQVFPWPTLRLLFTLMLVLACAAAAWQENRQVYAYYESPSRYARLHPAERAAMEWMAVNLPAGSFIVGSQVNRHTEWIDVLTPHRWLALSPAQLDENLPTTFTHLLFLRKREKPPAKYAEHADLYPIAFQNEAAVLFELHPTPAP